jgi:carbon-monoxide dehydrogenase large subunit
MACFVESSGVAPSKLAGMMGARGGFYEAAQVRVAPDGSVTAYLGTHSHGQGHETAYAQILASSLGIALENIKIVEGDTAAVPIGTGTFGSRSIAVGGSALHVAAGKIIEKGKRIAAHLLEASEQDVGFSGGHFEVTGTDRRLSFARIAGAAYVPHNYPHDRLEPGLDENAFYDPPNFAFSNGAHACEVEVDPETGQVQIVGYWTVDDIGTVINPLLVEGQIHGGLAQGLGQALMERTAYEGGQLLSASFMDYALPRAADLPAFEGELDQSQPCTHNPLGAKGCGESGAIGSPAALVSAVLDALAPLGVKQLEMPATPHRVWEAIMANREAT